MVIVKKATAQTTPTATPKPDGIRCAIWGLEGSGKSSMALTFPKPMFHLELDLGGFERAAWRLPKSTRILRLDETSDLKLIDWNSYDIVTKPYPIPVQIEKLLGAQSMGVGNKATIKFPRRVIGYKEIWQRLVLDYIEVCQVPNLSTIVVDSATQCWTVCHTSLLQEKQEIQLAGGIRVEDSKFREKLQPVEFPNDRMRSLIYMAKTYRKNLVLTHYPRNVYKEKFDSKGELIQYKSDDIEPDGFKDTSKLVDVAFWAYAEKTKERTEPRARITIKCGLVGMGMTAVGLELPEATYDGIKQMQKLLSGEDTDET